MKFEYAPGLPGYGTKGSNGTEGLTGLSLYFCGYDGLTEVITIRTKILANKILFPVDEDLPGYPIRVYQTGDEFIDKNGKVFIIDLTIDDKYYVTSQALNTTGFFELGTVTDTPVYQRYSNSFASDKFLVDTVYASNTAIANYAGYPSDIYGIAAKDFAEIKYVINEKGTLLYHPYTVYTNTNSFGTDENSFAIVKEPGNNNWHIGNKDGLGNTRANDLYLDFESVFVNGALINTADLTNLLLPGWLNVTGDSSMRNAFAWTLDVRNGTLLRGALTVTGASTLNGATTVNNTLGVGAYATSLGGTLGVTGITTLTGALNANGASVVNNTLGVTGITTLSILKTTSDASVEGKLNILGDTSIGGTLRAAGQTYIANNLTINGGNLKLPYNGDSTKNNIIFSESYSQNQIEIRQLYSSSGRLSIWSDWNSALTLAERFRFNGNDFYALGNITGYYTMTSDIRLKKNIEPLTNSLDKILQLNGISYDLKTGGHHLGFIAQEVEPIIPEVISESTILGGEDNDTIYKTINYIELIPHLVESIKTQQDIINNLTQSVKELMDEVYILKNK